MFDFKNKNVLITGGSRGIGFATAIAFAKGGANVAFTYRSNDAAAEAARLLMEAEGVKSLKDKRDTRNQTGLSALIEKMVKEWGSLDIAVASAGTWPEAKIDEMTIEEFRETMEVNMTGSYVLANLASKIMIAQKSGSIIFISSTAGQRGESGHSHYAASKGAQISFTKSLAVELAPHGIRVNCVAPGWVETDMTREALSNPVESQRVRSLIPLARAGKPEEIANSILFLASPLASYITGEVLNVNGGMVLCG
jgi:3-oxoacyl-[acyl-carrier protein] reductase